MARNDCRSTPSTTFTGDRKLRRKTAMRRAFTLACAMNESDSRRTLRRCRLTDGSPISGGEFHCVHWKIRPAFPGYLSILETSGESAWRLCSATRKPSAARSQSLSTERPREWLKQCQNLWSTRETELANISRFTSSQHGSGIAELGRHGTTFI